MISERMSATIHRIYSRTHADTADAASEEDLMRAEDCHIKSITVFMSIIPGSSQTIVLTDIREDVCNDS